MSRDKFLRHEPCPQCKSKDNVSAYASGFKQCEGCGWFQKGNGEISMTEQTRQYIPMELPTNGKTLTSQWLGSDRITEFGLIEWTDVKQQTWVVFPVYHTNRPVALKKRLLRDSRGTSVWNRKDFRWDSEGDIPGIFGMQTWRGRDGLILTEGEMDAVAVSTAYGMKYDVGSITKGANAAVESVRQHLEDIAGYKEIIICFDMDEPGRKASDEVLKILPPGRGKVASLSKKDAFDVLREPDGGQTLRYELSKAKAFIPKTLVTGNELVRASLERTRKSQRSGIKTGYPSLDKLSGGFKPGEVITIVAGTGVGKTSFTVNLTYNISVVGDSKTLFIPLEMGLDNIVNRLYELHTGNRVYTPEGIVIHDDFEAVGEEVCENLVVFDHIGSLEIEKLINDIQFASSAYGVNCIVLDHKDAAVATLDSGDNGYKAIDAMMGTLKKVAIDCACTIILVSHQSRSQDDKNDTKACLSRVRGSQGVAQNSDMVIGLERERDSNITTVKTLKAHRLIGVFGDFPVLYDPDTKRMREATLSNAEIPRAENQMERSELQEQSRSNSSPTPPPTGV